MKNNDLDSIGGDQNGIGVKWYFREQLKKLRVQYCNKYPFLIAVMGNRSDPD